MCADASHAPGAPQSAAEALRMARSAAGYLNTAEAAGLDGAACGEALVALGEIQAKLAAAQMGFLRRFDAADAHDAGGYGTAPACLAAKTRISRKDARARVRDMRRLTQRPLLRAALAAGDISTSWAAAIEEWTGKLPRAMREQPDKILLQAIAGGAGHDDLAMIAGLAIEKWRQQRPDDDDDDRFNDRFARFGTTFAGAGVIRGDLTPGCAAAVTAVFDALGKKRGKDDRRTQDPRYHDALQEACTLLIRARMVPGRAGADTQAVAHIGLSQLRDLPGASELEDAWIRAKLGEPGYLAGKDAEVAACDSMTVPVVTGHPDLTVIDKIIALVLAARAPAARRQPMSPAARQAHRYAIARLAAGFVSGPGGLASALRTGLLHPPYSTPSLPLDIGHSDSIPAHIRRAVILRDQHCGWPGGCDRPAAASDVHHLTHKKDGGPTSVQDCGLFCEFHHETCIHRWGWQVILHPDGTYEATSPDGRQTLRKHQPLTDPGG